MRLLENDYAGLQTYLVLSSFVGMLSLLSSALCVMSLVAAKRGKLSTVANTASGISFLSGTIVLFCLMLTFLGNLKSGSNAFMILIAAWAGLQAVVIAIDLAIRRRSIST